METRAHHVRIGLFTVIVVAAGLLFGLWMAKAGSEQDAEAYDIVFREAVTGLSIGSRVLYSGIHVGTVERIAIDPEDPNQVIARVWVAETTPVKRDTRAELVLANLTGASEIQLMGGSPDAPPLEGEGDEVPTIVAERSGIARLRGSSAELFNEVSRLVDRGNRLLSEENAENLALTLEGLGEVSRTLAGQDDTIRLLLQSLALASQEASQLLQRVNGLADSRGEALLTRAEQTMGSLESTTARLDRLLLENEDSLANGIQGLSGLGPALEELRMTLTTLERVARRVEEDPGAYIFGRESVREFQP